MKTSFFVLFYSYLPLYISSTEVLKENEVEKIQSNHMLQGDGWKEQ